MYQGVFDQAQHFQRHKTFFNCTLRFFWSREPSTPKCLSISDCGNVKILNRTLQGFSKPEMFKSISFKSLYQEFFAVVIMSNTRFWWDEFIWLISKNDFCPFFYWKIFQKMEMERPQLDTVYKLHQASLSSSEFHISRVDDIAKR